MTVDDLFARMAAGEVYDDLVDDLTAARVAAVHATDRYNASYGRPAAEREALLREVVAAAGDGATFEPTFRCEFGRNIRLGAGFFANFDCVLLDGAPIVIGDRVLFGPKVGLYTSNHALDPVERGQGACRAGAITVGDDVWIGGGTTVLPGVTIGTGAVVGAGSVVTREVPAGTVAVGNPARVLREITADDRTGYRPSH